MTDGLFLEIDYWIFRLKNKKMKKPIFLNFSRSKHIWLKSRLWWCMFSLNYQIFWYAYFVNPTEQFLLIVATHVPSPPPKFPLGSPSPLISLVQQMTNSGIWTDTIESHYCPFNHLLGAANLLFLVIWLIDQESSKSLDAAIIYSDILTTRSREITYSQFIVTCSLYTVYHF